jgi:hypothetical protein
MKNLQKLGFQLELPLSNSEFLVVVVIPSNDHHLL